LGDLVNVAVVHGVRAVRFPLNQLVREPPARGQQTARKRRAFVFCIDGGPSSQSKYPINSQHEPKDLAERNSFRCLQNICTLLRLWDSFILSAWNTAARQMRWAARHRRCG
jgi:hypothetical protein